MKDPYVDPYEGCGHGHVYPNTNGAGVARCGGEGLCSKCKADAEHKKFVDGLIAALEAVLNSDMAMREEDEGRKSPTLKQVRKALRNKA